MDCYQKLLRRDLRFKSKLRNGEYQCPLIMAKLGIPNFVNSHVGPIRKDVKHSQKENTQELPGVAYYLGRRLLHNVAIDFEGVLDIVVKQICWFGTLGLRYCWEALSAHGKLTFYGSIERIKCVTEHEDFLSLTHAAVLTAVAPLLEKKDGSTYNKTCRSTVNEYAF